MSFEIYLINIFNYGTVVGNSPPFASQLLTTIKEMVKLSIHPPGVETV